MLLEVQKVGGFSIIELQHGLIFDDSNGPLPSRLLGYNTESSDQMVKYATSSSTTFGGVHEGEIFIYTHDKVWGPLTKGFYFSVTGEFFIRGTGKVVLFERIGFEGMFLVGGPIEETGRLKFIDGCTDTVVVYPPRLGDACMNILYFPKQARQSMHTHPSIRYGLVVSGEGRCITPEGELPLPEGYVFRLEVEAEHCFHTDDTMMAIYSYHPDSDWGPTDEVHPMINRTTVVK